MTHEWPGPRSQVPNMVRTQQNDGLQLLVLAESNKFTLIERLNIDGDIIFLKCIISNERQLRTSYSKILDNFFYWLNPNLQ